MARRISKASKRRLSLFGTISIFIIGYFIFSLFYNVYTLYDLTKEKNNLKNYYAELQEKTNDLKSEIEKLNDDKYLADYAREHYLYSKNGEYIIQIDKLNETENMIDDISSNINKNYLMIGLSFIVFMMFIYIIKKNRKNNKKKN